MFSLEDKGVYKVGYLNSIRESESNPPKIKMLEWIEYSSLDESLKKLKGQQLDMLVDFSTNPFQFWISQSSPKSAVAEKIFLSHYMQTGPDTPIKKEVQGRNIKYIDWLFPGLLTMNVMWMALWGVGWVVVRQRKLGILKRFKASPIRAHEYLIAQVLSRVIVLGLSGVMLFAGSHLIYPFQTMGSYFDIFVIYMVGCLSLSSIGLVIAARMTSEEFANGLLNLLTYPMMFLSEIWFSLEGSSEWVKTAAQFSPLYHMTDGIRKIMNEGKTLSELSWELTVLVVIFIVFTVSGSLMFRWNKD